MSGLLYNGDMAVRMQNARALIPKRMLQLLKEDSRICYLTADGLSEGSKIRQAMNDFPDRIIDVGIAETNLVGIAAGLALSGKIPFIQAIGSFLSMRTVEHIHTDVAYNDVPVRIISSHGGVTSGGGPTHNSIIDFSIMNAIPNMTVIAPADGEQCIKAINASVDYPGPVFIRIARGSERAVYPTDFDYEYKIGEAIRLRDGNNATLIGVSAGVSLALQAALKLEQENIKVRVIDMHTIKPLDKKTILDAAKETGIIITVEDHNIEGGLGTLVAATIAEAGVSCKIRKLGIPDEFSVLGSAESIYSYYGFNVDDIADVVKSLVYA